MRTWATEPASLLDTALDIAACINVRLEGPAVSVGQPPAPPALDALSPDVPPAQENAPSMCRKLHWYGLQSSYALQVQPNRAAQPNIRTSVRLQGFRVPAPQAISSLDSQQPCSQSMPSIGTSLRTLLTAPRQSPWEVRNSEPHPSFRARRLAGGARRSGSGRAEAPLLAARLKASPIYIDRGMHHSFRS